MQYCNSIILKYYIVILSLLTRSIMEMMQIVAMFAPTLTAVLVIVVGYRYGIKKFRFEANQQETRKIRVAVSNLLLIWSELEHIKYLASSHKPYDQLIAKIPFLSKDYLKVNEKKIAKLRSAYSESLKSFKEFNVVQYCRLESALEYFELLLDDLLIPLSNDVGTSIAIKAKSIIPLLEDLCGDMGGTIKHVSRSLPGEEQVQIETFLNRNIDRDEEERVPDFLVKIVNTVMPFKIAITKADLYAFYSDATVLWCIDKVMTSDFAAKIFTDKVFKFLRLASGDHKEIESLNGDMYRSLLTINISNEDAARFVNNKKFYLIILGAIYNINGKVTYKEKRALAAANMGKISMTSVAEYLKKTISEEITKN